MPAMLAAQDFVKNSQAMTRQWGLAESLAYTRALATSHYENFHVVSFLLPKRLHQDFYNVYSFCRWADDLGDEIGDTVESLRLLAWWREELHAMYLGRTRHPVFTALRGTSEKYRLPQQTFDDLITAFIHDQTVTRYANWDEVMDYCHYSANPVGRLVLGLCGFHDEERHLLSDFTCTALQLANFWQDVTVDLKKDRIYIPLDVMAKHGYTPEELFANRFTPAFRELMREICGVAHDLFVRGLPLVEMVDRRLSIDLDLFSRGGMRVLDKIKALDYNVLAQRPHISKSERVGLLLGTLARAAFRTA
jgi:squalene synthase HpnC